MKSGQLGMIHRMRNVQAFAALLMGLSVLGLCTGCGPSLPSSLSLPKIKISSEGNRTRNTGSATSYVYVDEFIDSRGSSAIAILDGKDIPHKEDVSPVIVDGVKQALKQRGFEFSETAPIVLSGEIRQWIARVTSGFSSKVDAEASLYVEVLDPANKRIYAGVYNGFATVESPSLGTKDVQTALQTCLEEAIGQITADGQLTKLLSSF